MPVEHDGVLYVRCCCCNAMVVEGEWDAHRDYGCPGVPDPEPEVEHATQVLVNAVIEHEWDGLTIHTFENSQDGMTDATQLFIQKIEARDGTEAEVAAACEDGHHQVDDYEIWLKYADGGP